MEVNGLNFHFWVNSPFKGTGKDTGVVFFFKRSPTGSKTGPEPPLLKNADVLLFETG